MNTEIRIQLYKNLKNCSRVNSYGHFSFTGITTLDGLPVNGREMAVLMPITMARSILTNCAKHGGVVVKQHGDHTYVVIDSLFEISTNDAESLRIAPDRGRKERFAQWRKEKHLCPICGDRMRDFPSHGSKTQACSGRKSGRFHNQETVKFE